jgi:hypothetical protein
MKAPVECKHESFDAHVSVGRMEDTGRFMADVKITCTECNEPFRFLGVPPGISWERPACSIDSLELHAPIEPEGEKQLFARATFQMPPELSRRKGNA